MSHFYTALTDRLVLGLEGPMEDIKELLQRTTTQDMAYLSAHTLTYTAHLTPQGKVLYDMFVLQKEEHWVLLDVHATHAMDLAKSLHTYAAGKDIAFHDLSDTYALYALWGEDFSSLLGLDDPRLPLLGRRMLHPVAETFSSSSTAVPLTQYHAHRLACGVPDVGLDIPPSKALVAELGLEYLNGVSFTKGCYIGQEVTARMEHKTQPKKRFFQATYSQEAPMGTPVLKGGREIGVLGSCAQGSALALLRMRDLVGLEEPDFPPLTVLDDPLLHIRLPSYIPPLA